MVTISNAWLAALITFAVIGVITTLLALTVIIAMIVIGARDAIDKSKEFEDGKKCKSETKK